MEKDFRICKCGLVVNGTSSKHANANLKIHMKSKLHMKIMKIHKYNKLKGGNTK